MNDKKVIIIDDEIDFATLISDMIKSEGYDTLVYNNGQKFKSDYNIYEIDLIILDLMMPDVDGIEIIRFLAEKDYKAKIILISGYDSGVLHSAEQLAQAHGLDIIKTLNKPFRMNTLLEYLSRAKVLKQDVCLFNIHQNITVLNLQEACAKKEFIVYFQPKVNLDNSAVALEALVRWKNPKYGIIPPDDFIPLLEEQGLIDEMTWIVIEEVFDSCKKWKEYGLSPCVSINMSSSTLQDLNIPEKLSVLLKKYDLKSSQIVLEITETALMKELIKSLDILTRLRIKGFKLSIDDFGTGYSSLIQLHRVPFSEIKIDKSFVMNILNDKESLVISEIIVDLGHKLDMKVVAEGVETQKILDKLRDIGCDIIQGYYISKPLPYDEITSWLIENK